MGKYPANKSPERASEERQGKTRPCGTLARRACSKARWEKNEGCGERLHGSNERRELDASKSFPARPRRDDRRGEPDRRRRGRRRTKEGIRRRARFRRRAGAAVPERFPRRLQQH